MKRLYLSGEHAHFIDFTHETPGHASSLLNRVAEAPLSRSDAFCDLNVGNPMQAGFISESCYNLLYLELAACRLTSLPTELARLVPNLRVLNLNYNFLEDLRGLEGLTRLRKLTIIGSRIKATKQFVRMLKGMRDVEILDFRYVVNLACFVFPDTSPAPEGNSVYATASRSPRPDPRPLRFGPPHRAGFAPALACGSHVVRGVMLWARTRPSASIPLLLTHQTLGDSVERVLAERAIRCRAWVAAGTVEGIHQSIRHPAFMTLPAVRVRLRHFHLHSALSRAFAHAGHAEAEPP